MTCICKGTILRSRFLKVLSISGLVIVTLVIISVAQVLSFRWTPPPASAFIMQKRFSNLFHKGDTPAVHYKWVSRKTITPLLGLAVIAAEDQKFPMHRGFDFESISSALEKNKKSRRIRGASTITQQVAKNLFLWSDKSYIRKGLEAWYTVLLELLWPKQRILEVYLNISEFGDGVYGVAAASQVLLKKDHTKLTMWDTAVLAAVLPSPKRMHADRPSPYVRGRAQWIIQQMEQLGGLEYIKSMK
ncbi:MAG TPA: monofunctional biosynthetic peptidoglycan transglycosylase [bacterium]|nr:monofunctional biosynthetic peptidoglycan transglycosylase [bacterium]HPN44584.1 monofunctional biosynthetic peptidoglycan transglycosylase [bacterium]